MKNKRIVLSLIFSVVCFFVVSQVSARVVTVTATKGRVEMQRAGSNTWDPVVSSTQLNISDKIQTKKGSMCELTLDDGSLIKIKENSTLEINELSEDASATKKNSVFKLLIGKIWSKAQLQNESTFKVVTPTAIAGIKGTEFAIIVSIDGSSDILVFKGSVEVKSLREEIDDIKTVLVEAGKALGVKLDESGNLRDVTTGEQVEWQKFIESKKVIDIKITEQERQEIRLEVAELRNEIKERRVAALEAKSGDFAAGRTMRDHNKEIVRVEQLIYRPSGDSIRFLNMNMRGTPSPEHLQYFQADLVYDREIPIKIIDAAKVLSSAELKKMECTWANAAPSVTKRDEIKQGWVKDTTRTEGGYSFMRINDKDVEFTSDPSMSSPDGEDKLHVRTSIPISTDGGTNLGSIKMEGYVIDNDGNVLSLSSAVSGNPYNTIKNNVGFEIVWDLRGVGAGITLNNGGIIDVVFIPDIIFAMVDTALAEIGNLSSADIMDSTQ